MVEDVAWRRVGTDWREVVLVCRKCSRKLDGGFGPDGDQGLAKALRRCLDGGARKVKLRRRAVAVVEVGCLDVCPKRAVAVVKASEPRAMVIVPAGASVEAVAAGLALRPGREPAGGGEAG